MGNQFIDTIELQTSGSSTKLGEIYDDAAGQAPDDSVSDGTAITLTHNDRLDLERMGNMQVLRVDTLTILEYFPISVS